MTTVLIATEKPFADDANHIATKIMQDAGLDVKFLRSYTNPSDLVSKLQSENIEGLIVRSDKITADIMQQAPHLELIVRAGVGYDNVDVNFAEEQGIVVQNTPGVNANGVSQLVYRMLLERVRTLDGKSGRELTGKLGILGAGNIGQIVASTAQGMGLEVHVHDPYLTRDREDSLRAKKYNIHSSKEDLFQDAEIISLHIPLTEQTKGSINYDLIQMMNPKGTLVNTARAGIVNIKDLRRILEERERFGFVSDVDQNVKLELGGGFGNQVIITPKKQGAQTTEANTNAAIAAARQTVKYFVSGNPINVVNNPLPLEKRIFTSLATYLGKFTQAYIGKPEKIRIICYGELEQYQAILGSYVVKGLVEAQKKEIVTPSNAIAISNENGVEIDYIAPDNTKGHGNSITIDYFAGAEHQNIRGRIDSGQVQLQKVGEFNTSITLTDGTYLAVEYNDSAGMADKIGRTLTDVALSKIEGVYRPNTDGSKAMYILRLGSHKEVGETVELVAEKHIRSISGVLDAKVIQL